MGLQLAGRRRCEVVASACTCALPTFACGFSYAVCKAWEADVEQAVGVLWRGHRDLLPPRADRVFLAAFARSEGFGRFTKQWRGLPSSELEGRLLDALVR